jgi:hypothetical protein
VEGREEKRRKGGRKEGIRTRIVGYYYIYVREICRDVERFKELIQYSVILRCSLFRELVYRIPYN